MLLNPIKQRGCCTKFFAAQSCDNRRLKTRKGGTSVTHLSEDEVERFFAARLDPSEQQRVARHLLTGCAICGRKLVEQAPGSLLEKMAADRHPEVAGSSPRDRTLAVALKQEARRLAGEAKLARSLELLRESPYDALSFRQVRVLPGPSLVEDLVTRSHELRYRDPKTARWLAFNALKAAESLRPEECKLAARFDLQALAWAALANTYKLNEQFAEADGAIERAGASLRRGSRDPRLLARIAEFEASIRIAQRRLIEAGKLLKGACNLYLRLGDRHHAGRALIALGGLSERDGKYRQGILFLRRSMPLLDPDRDPYLVGASKQTLITLLVGGGDYGEAGRLLLKSDLRNLLIDLPHVRWTEGRLLAGLGKTAKSESALTQVRDEFSGRGQPYAASLVGLDLLDIWHRNGKSSLVRAAAREIYDTLQNLGIRQEAAKARRYLQ
jgi:tetratricopeptide (TPR) repeat protein